MRPAAVVILALAGLLGSGCATLRADDPWLGRDKYAHLAVSSALGAGAAKRALHAGHGGAAARGRALGVVFVIGAGKEAYDARYKPDGYWSWKDMGWNLLGGLLGGLAVTVGQE